MISDQDLELLMAYVDGELDEGARRQVETRLCADAEAAAMVETLRRTDGALADAVNEMARAAPDGELRRGVEAAFAAAERREARRLQGWRMGPLVAAAAASLVIGVFGGYQLALTRSDAARAATALIRKDRQLMQQTVNAALESKVSGTSLSWRNPDSGSRGTVTPVRTFKTTKGQWCREYKLAARFVGWQEDFRAIACRGADSHWRTVLRAPGASASL